MGDWIGLGIILLVVAGALVGLSYLGKPAKPLSEEEYERRAREGPGVLSAGVMGLQKILDPGTAKAVAAQQDLKAGYYNDEEKEGEGDAPGQTKKGLKPTEEEGDDA
jgi:hypothetical protein